MEYTEAAPNEYPICPFCEKELDEVKYKNLSGGFFGKRKLMFFCPRCRKVLGNADAGGN